MLQTLLKVVRKSVKRTKTGQTRPKPKFANDKSSTAVAAVPVVGTVVSFPKSGRTWLRVMLDDLAIPCAYTHDRSSHKEAFLIDDLGKPGANLTSEKIIFVHRDPRDTVISGFHQATKRLKSYQGDLSAFIRDPRHGIEKIAVFNLGWLTGGPDGAAIHRISYEQMMADTEGTLSAIADFVGVTVTPEQVSQAVDNNRFDKMQARERAGNFDARYGPALRANPSADPEGLKVRRGKVGGFQDDLKEDDIAFCDAVLGRLEYWRRVDGA